jgi:hypothetical protein
MKDGACHAERSEARRGGLFLVKNKSKLILRFLESDGLHRSPEIGPLPPRRSKLWSAVRMRDRDDIVGAFFISLSG